MFEEDGKYLLELYQRVRGMGIATSMDLAAVDAGGASGKADWEKILERVLPYVDFFTPSFEEICFMLDRPRYERLSKKAGGGDLTLALDLQEDILPIADRCLELGARVVLLKCGAPGMYLKCSKRCGEIGERLGFSASAWNGFSAFEKSFRIDRVLSGNGAGDASIAAFLSSILKGAGPSEALEMAAAAGALCCSAYDAVSGLMPLAEIRKKIDAGWEKY
jgi:sugar/nucleoside kinase (ribokinase family)